MALKRFFSNRASASASELEGRSVTTSTLITSSTT
jgi:hypothetical protein